MGKPTPKQATRPVTDHDAGAAQHGHISQRLHNDRHLHVEVWSPPASKPRSECAGAFIAPAHRHILSRPRCGRRAGSPARHPFAQRSHTELNARVHRTTGSENALVIHHIYIISTLRCKAICTIHCIRSVTLLTRRVAIQSYSCTYGCMAAPALAVTVHVRMTRWIGLVPAFRALSLRRCECRWARTCAQARLCSLPHALCMRPLRAPFPQHAVCSGACTPDGWALDHCGREAPALCSACGFSCRSIRRAAWTSGHRTRLPIVLLSCIAPARQTEHTRSLRYFPPRSWQDRSAAPFPHLSAWCSIGIHDKLERRRLLRYFHILHFQDINLPYI